MPQEIAPLADRPAWKSLAAHAAEIKSTTLRELFKDDPARGTRFNAEA